MISRVKLLACIVAMLGLTVAGASASPIVQVQSFGPGTPNFIQTLTFNEYSGVDPLGSIEVKLDLAITGGQLYVDNDGGDIATVTVYLGAYGDITSADVTLLDAAFNPVTATASCSTSDTFNLDPDDGDGTGNVDPSPLDGATLSGGSVCDSQSGLINAAFFGDYTGTGTYTIDIDIKQILDFGSVGGVEGGFSPVTACGSVTVIYNPIPEPMTLSLLALGGLVTLIRRKK